MVILGLDPGLASLGWCLVHFRTGCQPRALDGGVIRTKADKRGSRADDLERRTRELVAQLRTSTHGCAFNIVAAESMSWPQHHQAKVMIALAWGGIVALAEERQAPVLQYTPKDVKLEVSGAASASKGDVQAVVEAYVENAGRLLARLPKTQQNHLADALAVALTSRKSPLVQTARRIAGG